MAKSYLVDDGFLRRVAQLERWQRAFRLSGPYVTGSNGAEGAAFYVGAKREERPAAGPRGFWARIASSVQEPPETTGDPPPWRWTYAFYRVTKTAPGYGGWTNGSLESSVAYNSIEEEVSLGTLLGNGVAIDDFAGTGLEPQPAPPGVIVWMVPVTAPAAVDDEAGQPTTEHWFAYENAVSGPCNPEP